MTPTSPVATGNIVLTGFMGTGKTTVGRIIAARLGVGFVDTDAMIEAVHGPIATIFAEHGEAHFRELERALASRLAAEPAGRVIATGGGMLLDPDSARELAATGPVYALTADPEIIVARVTTEHGVRPLLAGDDPTARVDALLVERAPVYGRFIQVDTGSRDPHAIAVTIIEDALDRGALRIDRSDPPRRATPGCGHPGP